MDGSDLEVARPTVDVTSAAPPDASRLESNGSRRGLLEMLRYLVVSAVALGIDVGAMAVALRVLHLDYLTAATIGFSLGLCVNYVLARTWAFASRVSRVRNRLAEFAVFAAIGVVGLVINDAIIAVVTESLRVDPLVSKIVAAGVVFAWNFFLRRYVLFRNSAQLTSSQG